MSCTLSPPRSSAHTGSRAASRWPGAGLEYPVPVPGRRSGGQVRLACSQPADHNIALAAAQRAKRAGGRDHVHGQLTVRVRGLRRHRGQCGTAGRRRGADRLLHRGVAAAAGAAARLGVRAAVVSQIHVTRPQAYPAMVGVIAARRRGEDAVRESGAPYLIVRPGRLHDGPARGTRVEQGATGDGHTSRDRVADARVAALGHPGPARLTFEPCDDAIPAGSRSALRTLMPGEARGD